MTVWSVFWVAFEILVIYLPVLTAPMTGDDEMAILWQKGVLAGDWWRELWGHIWRGPVFASYALDVKCGGRENRTLPFHVTNMMLHLGAALAAGAILSAMGYPAAETGAGAMIFAAHPLAVPAVSYLTARSSLMAAFCAGIAVLAALDHHDLVAIAALMAAMWMKEDSAVYAMAPLFIWFEHGDFAVIGVWAVMVMTAAFLWKADIMRQIRRLQDLQNIEPGVVSSVKPWPEYAPLSFSENIIRFPGWILGVGLNFYHFIPARIVQWRLTAAVAILAWAVLAFRVGTFEIRLAIVMIAGTPVWMYIAVPIKDMVLDYRNYGVISGVSVLAVALGHGHPHALWALATVWGAASVMGAMNWASPLRVALDGYHKGTNRNYGVRLQLASQYVLMGQLKNGERFALEALEMCPQAHAPQVCLAVIDMSMAMKYRKDEDPEKSAFCFERAENRLIAALEAFLQGSLAWENLGLIYQKTGRLSAAEACYRSALRYQPQQVGAWGQLGVVLTLQERFTEAADAFRQAAGLRPDKTEYRLEEARSYARAGMPATAAHLFAAIEGIPVDSGEPEG